MVHGHRFAAQSIPAGSSSQLSRLVGTTRLCPKFNTDHPDVREYLMGVAEHWTAQGIDGWRLDVPAEITTPGFWEEFRARVRALNPEAYLVGEIWDDASAWLGRGDRFDAAMNYVFTGKTLAFVAGERVDPELADGVDYPITPAIDAAEYGDAITELLSLYPEHLTRSTFNLLGSHDTARPLTVADGDVDSVVLAALLMFTHPGAPCVYYGDEIGMTGGKDPASRGAFPWDDPSFMEPIDSAGLPDADRTATCPPCATARFLPTIAFSSRFGPLPLLSRNRSRTTAHWCQRRRGGHLGFRPSTQPQRWFQSPLGSRSDQDRR